MNIYLSTKMLNMSMQERKRIHPHTRGWRRVMSFNLHSNDLINSGTKHFKFLFLIKESLNHSLNQFVSNHRLGQEEKAQLFSFFHFKLFCSGAKLPKVYVP